MNSSTTTIQNSCDMLSEALAIEGGRPAKATPYGVGKRFGEAEEKAAVAAIRSQKLWYLGGKFVFETEALICKMYDVRHAVLCSSGTAAVHTALAVCGVEAGDEVIVNPISDWGSILGILALGATPVFADVDESTYSLDPACVESAISAKTKAILLVHLGGYPARVKEISVIAKKRGLKLVEDCAQSHYAFLDGKALGTYGDVAAFSTNDSKQISCGEGGFVMTNDPHLAKMARLFTDKGYDRDAIRERGTQDVAFMAFNYRMSELSAAVLGVQLQSLPEQIHGRKNYHVLLMQHMGDVSEYRPLKVQDGGQGSYWSVMGRLDLTQFKVDRKTLVTALRAEGIFVTTGMAPSRILYSNTVFQKKTLYPMSSRASSHSLASRSYDGVLCPVAERIVDSSMTFPCSPFFTGVDARETAMGIKKVFRYYHR